MHLDRDVANASHTLEQRFLMLILVRRSQRYVVPARNFDIGSVNSAIRRIGSNDTGLSCGNGRNLARARQSITRIPGRNEWNMCRTGTLVAEHTHEPRVEGFGSC